jgi:thymidine phosphorylase
MQAVAETFGLTTRFVFTDGSQPVGRGIGPALEAFDVLAVLRNEAAAPADLRARSLLIAAAVLELGGAAQADEGLTLAEEALVSGRALAKFERICEAQGGMRVPSAAPLRRGWTAPHSGVLTHVNNRKLSRLAKLAGAPDDKAAGVELHIRLGDHVSAGRPLVTIHAEAPGELDYAMAYAAANADMFEIEA